MGREIQLLGQALLLDSKIEAIAFVDWSGSLAGSSPWNENGRGVRSECSLCVKQTWVTESYDF